MENSRDNQYFEIVNKRINVKFIGTGNTGHNSTP